VLRLIDRAVAAAHQFADPSQRAALQETLAAAALTAAASTGHGRRRQHTMLIGLASSAASQDQLDLLRAWLDGSRRLLPDGIEVDLGQRARMLANLAAYDRVTDDDLAAYAAADPVLPRRHQLRPQLPAGHHPARSPRLPGRGADRLVSRAAGTRDCLPRPAAQPAAGPGAALG
jgi:hypothetical protein